VIDNDRPDASSIRRTARMAGLVYLVTACVMVFAFMVQPRAFIVGGNAAATAQKILEGQTMYRIMVLNSLIAQVLFIFVALLLYQLFRNVDRWYARAMAVLVLVAIAADLVVTANRLAPIDLLVGNDFLSVFSRPQREALSLAFLYLGGNLTVVLTMFWGLWLIPFGILVIKSGWFPKVLGILLMVAGFGYILTSFTYFVLPVQLKTFRQMLMPLYFGEVPIILWMLIRGAKVPDAAPAA
jgi:uncharacterized protein DUF4386